MHINIIILTYDQNFMYNVQTFFYRVFFFMYYRGGKKKC